MDDKCNSRRTGESAEPSVDFIRISMGGHGFDERHFGADGNHLTMDFDGLLAIDELAPSRALCLISDEQDRIPRIREGRLEVMQYPSACCHATRRNDDGRHFRLRQLFRFSGRRNRAKPLGAEHTQLTLLPYM